MCDSVRVYNVDSGKPNDYIDLINNVLSKQLSKVVIKKRKFEKDEERKEMPIKSN